MISYVEIAFRQGRATKLTIQFYLNSANFLPALEICRVTILLHDFFTDTGHCTKHMDPDRHCVRVLPLWMCLCMWTY